MIRRLFSTTAVAAVALAAAGFANAATPIKFQLDWRFEGPSALFLVPVAKGYFKDAGLDVTVDSGNGSGGAVTRVAWHLRHGFCRLGGTHGVSRQQPRRA